MDESTHKHNVIARHNEKLQLWDTDTNKVLVTYDTTGYAQAYQAKIKYNRNIMIVTSGFRGLQVFEIYTGKEIKQFENVYQCDICDTHMIILYCTGEVKITNLETMNETNFDLARGLLSMCINSTYVVGTDTVNKKIKILNYTVKQKIPPVEILTGSEYNPILINNKHVFLTNKFETYARVRIFSLDTGKLESDFTTSGSSCTMWLNSINNDVYVSTMQSMQNIKIITINSDTLQQATTFLETGNFAIGSAIAFLTPIPAGPNVAWSGYTYDMMICCNNKTTIYKGWETNNTYFGIKAVILDEATFTKKILVKNVIPDIANIILGYTGW